MFTAIMVHTAFGQTKATQEEKALRRAVAGAELYGHKLQEFRPATQEEIEVYRNLLREIMEGF